MEFNTPKTTKFDAILKVVEALKAHGIAEHHITAERVLKGFSDRHINVQIRGIESDGFSRGSPNDFYQYLKKAKRAVFEKDQVEREGLEAEVQDLKKENASLLDMINELQQTTTDLLSEKRNLERQSEEKDTLIIYKDERIKNLEVENSLLHQKFGDMMSLQKAAQNLISDFKKTIEREFEAKTALMTKEMNDKVARSEGQANHYGTQLHEYKAKYKEAEKELKQLRNQMIRNYS